MGIWDWLIVIIPVIFIMYIGFYSSKYIKGVADFLSAGRVAGRYLMSMGDVASALSIIGLVSYVEMNYKTGFALVFWNSLLMPVTTLLGLYGFCTYRFRETKAMSLGQFLEMRYNRPFRIFASCLRSFSEMLANMIMPAVAARFFIYVLDLPPNFSLCGVELSTFTIVVVICLTLAVSLVCFGGTLSIMITDALQGMLLFPLMLFFIVFILYKFDWNTQMVSVMSDRVAGESFLNPYDVSNLRDFNLLMIVLTVVVSVIHRASWIGAGNSTAAKSPHEQKMAGVLGTWRGALNALFYVLVAVGIITFLNHKSFSSEAKKVRDTMSISIGKEIIPEKYHKDFANRINSIPEQKHEIGVDAPLSQAENLETAVFDVAHNALKDYNGEAEGNAKFQEFRTLYNQLMMAFTMKNLLPPVALGLFVLMMFLAMVSTDDSTIFSASLTFTQDVIMPLKKKEVTPRQHIWILRFASIGVGVFYLIGSNFMSQLDYIKLFYTLMCMMWLGGCAPVMLFGLYSRFGNTAGAFSAIISGMVLSLGSIVVQRNWAGVFYPWLSKMGWIDGLGYFLEVASKPFNPYIVWKMDAVKFPINAFELYIITMILTLFIFCAVSWLTQKEPFNLDRMLHRGIYNTDHENKTSFKLTWKTLLDKLVGITPEYTRGDRVIAWSVMFYSVVYKFVFAFVLVVAWNFFSPWPIEWWGHYFFITTLLIPGIAALVSFFWFTIGGSVDIWCLFRDLKKREVNHLDNGQVEGNVSLADKAAFAKIESENFSKRTNTKGEL